MFSDTSVVQQYANALNGLNEKQVLLALSYKKLSNEQKEQILTQMGLKASEDTIQSELLQTTLAQQKVNEEKSKAILIDLGLMDSNTGELFTQKACTKADLEAVLAQKGITGVQAEGIISALGLSGANTELAFSFDLLKKSIFNAIKPLLTNPWTYVAVGAVSLITILYQVSKAADEIADKAQEMSQEFSDTKSSIEDYKSQISDLYKTINDSKSSIEEVATARQNLLSIQDELIEKFGDEEENIRLVTDAIYGQVSALDELTEKKWQETLNDFNKEGFWNNIGNSIAGYDDNIDRMVDQMENHTIKLNLSNAFDSLDSSEFKRFEKILSDKFGMTISPDIDGNVYAEINGYADDIYDKILEIQKLSDDFEFSNSFSKELTNAANSAKDLTDKYSDLYDQYILYEKIFKNEDASKYFKDIQNAYQDYQDAFTSGGDTDTAIAKLQGILDEAAQNIDDDSVIEFFRDMYPELQTVVDNWELKTKIIPGIDTRDLEGLSKSDILTALTEEGLQSGEVTFKNIIREAIEFGIITDDDSKSIEYLLDLLVEWGILQKDINETADDYEVLDPATITQSVKQIATQLEPQLAKLGELYQSIWYTDNGFDANVVDNSMLEELRASLLELEDDLGITFDPEAIEDFYNVLADGVATEKEAQDAFNALATSIFYSTDTLENLNEKTAASIVQQMEQLGVTNAQEVVDAALNQKKLELAASEEFLAKTGKDLAAATSEEVQAFIWSGQAADETADHFIYLALQKQVAEHPLNTAEDINNLALLCSALGVTGELYYRILDLKMAFNAVEAGAPIQAYQGTIDRLQTEIQALLKGENQIEVGFKVPDSGSGSASSAGKEAADEYLEAFEKELGILDDLKDQGKITEKQYLDQLRVNILPFVVVIRLKKVTITVKVRWDSRDRGKIDFRFRTQKCVLFYYKMITMNETKEIFEKIRPRYRTKIKLSKNAKTEEQFIKELLVKNPDVKLIGEYKGANIKTLFECVLNHRFYSYPSYILKSTLSGCKECRKLNK